MAAASVALGACGGKSDEDVRAERATFVREADEICERTSDDLARGGQPRDYDTLGARLQRDQRTLRTAVADLHGLRGKLGDSASRQIVAFDRQAEAVLAAAAPIGGHIELADSSAARRSAEKLRRAYDELYDLGAKAKLRQCGRGGNRAADTVLFTVYRSEYITVNSDVNLRLRFLDRDPQTFEAFRRYLRRSLKLVVNYRSRMGRLAPPKKGLLRRHRLLLRRTTQALRSARQLLRIAERGQSAIATGSAQALAMRVVRQADLADAADRSIRRILRPSPGSPEQPRPGPRGTDRA